MALAPCPDPTLLVPLNQYIMLGGGGVFTIPCSVVYRGSNPTFYSQLLNGLDWTIARAPSLMLPRVSNGSTASNGPCSFFPQHAPVTMNTPQPSPIPPPNATPIPTATPISGLAFVNNLPTLNSAFGTNSITHSFQGKSFAVSDFALFYNSTATTHPYGGPKGYYFSTALNGASYTYAEIDTPNWLYYYDQDYHNPWRYEIRYWQKAGQPPLSHYDQGRNITPANSFIWVGDDAHGLAGSPVANGGLAPTTELFGYPPASTVLTLIGSESTRGIDNYARVITHESSHKRMYDMIHSEGFGDHDGDRIPDVVEVRVGLNPNVPDSATLPGPGGGTWGSANPEYANEGYADAEVFCRMCEHNLLGPLNADWADDGLNYKAFRATPPNRCERVALGYIAYTAPASRWGNNPADRGKNFYAASTFPDALGILKGYPVQ